MLPLQCCHCTLHEQAWAGCRRKDLGSAVGGRGAKSRAHTARTRTCQGAPCWPASRATGRRRPTAQPPTAQLPTVPTWRSCTASLRLSACASCSGTMPCRVTAPSGAPRDSRNCGWVGGWGTVARLSAHNPARSASDGGGSRMQPAQTDGKQARQRASSQPCQWQHLGQCLQSTHVLASPGVLQAG